jgi:hypothetical protein
MSDNAVRQIVLASRPKGPPTPENFRLEEVSMPATPLGALLRCRGSGREAQTRPLSDANSMRSRSASRQGAKKLSACMSVRPDVRAAAIRCWRSPAPCPAAAATAAPAALPGRSDVTTSLTLSPDTPRRCRRA